MLVEVFKLVETCLIIGLSIASRFNRPIVWKTALGILTREITNSLNYQKQGNTLAFAINIDNRCSLFSIARLNSFASATSICACNNHSRSNYAYYKAGFVEVLEIVVLNAVFCSYILYQPELRSNKLRIFAQGSLTVVDAIKTRL